MKHRLLLALLLLSTPALAASGLDYYVGKSYNVRYFEVTDFNPEKVQVSVIWYEDGEAQFSAKRICDIDRKIDLVQWGSLSSYLKHQRDVRAAANEGWHNCQK